MNNRRLCEHTQGRMSSVYNASRQITAVGVHGKATKKRLTPVGAGALIRMVVHQGWILRTTCLLLLASKTVATQLGSSIDSNNTRHPADSVASFPRYTTNAESISASGTVLCFENKLHGSAESDGVEDSGRFAPAKEIPCFEETYDKESGSVPASAPFEVVKLEIESKSRDGGPDANNGSDKSSESLHACESDRPCIPLCCPPKSRVIDNRCVKVNNTDFAFPPVHDPQNLTRIDVKVDESNFHFFTWDPCNGGQKYKLDPDEYEEDSYMLLGNGSIHRGEYEPVLHYTNYCLGIVNKDQYDVVLCFEADPNENGVVEGGSEKINVSFPVGLIISSPFLLVTFLVYTFVPELKNMHGRTLRGYVGSLLVAYVVLAVLQIMPQDRISDSACILMAFVIHFSFLASFFWLNVMCFDIWWTFGGFRSLQGSIKQRERKKFIIYSIYAWGSASILTGICIIMDFVPTVPKSFIRPEFGAQSCWFTTDEAKAIYFYGPMGVTVICNICLFISTALKIIRHKRDTAHHLRGSESKRHDDNKQWFNLYLKLFIVMGINWSMEIVSWLCKGTPQYVWYITDLANTLQGLIIFIIFVWKDKIKRLLLKRFGCHDQSVLSRNSTRSAYQSSTTRTGMTSATPLQEKVNPYVQDGSYRNKITTDESDFS